MKKSIVLLGCLAFAFSCKCDKKGNVSTNGSHHTEEYASSNVINFDDIALSNKDLGAFPFFNKFDGYCFGDCNNPTDLNQLTKNPDKEYFVLNGELVGIEGKTFKTIVASKDNFNHLNFEENLKKSIIDLGGVDITTNGTTQKEFDRIGEDELKTKNYGYSINENHLEHVKTYLIKKDDKEIWIQFSPKDAESGTITVLEKDLNNNNGPSIPKELSTAEELPTYTPENINSDITSNGRSIVDINFNVNETSLNDHGRSVAKSVLETLKNNKDLKLSIEGYTDNSGSSSLNQRLSEQRAESIKNYLVENGIDASRLKSQGFGEKDPIVPNDTEANRRKNRRVELVKF